MKPALLGVAAAAALAVGAHPASAQVVVTPSGPLRVITPYTPPGLIVGGAVIGPGVPLVGVTPAAAVVPVAPVVSPYGVYYGGYSGGYYSRSYYSSPYYYHRHYYHPYRRW